MEKSVYIKTYGCQMNERESEALSAVLKKSGYTLASAEEDADVILLNTCSVREQAELKAIGKSNLVARAGKRQKLIGILGCMAQNLGHALLKKSPRTRLVVGPNGIARVPEYIDFLLNNPRESIVDTEFKPIEAQISAAHDPDRIKVSMFTSIMQGCNMHCAYCIVPKTRGPEQYRPMEDIIAEVQWLASHGTKEITLLGQIVNHYGTGQMPLIQGESPFVQLLRKIQSIDGIERIRFTSPHPKGFKEDLIEAYQNLSKLCPYVHLPLQSGSDKILRTMRRPYSRKSFLSIVRALRKCIPTISISTDIIVGFPGETEEDFQLTCDTFDEIKFDMAYIFKYSVRPGTIAETLGDQIPQEIKEERNQILLKKLEKYSKEYNDAVVGSICEVLVEKKAHRGESRLEGRTPEHKKVIFEGHNDWIGKFVKVQISAATASTLEGSVVVQS